jgi:hypothetical protein
MSIGSLIGQLGSAKVRGEIAFPTIEDRNPATRRADYEAALDALLIDVRPLAYTRARDLDPRLFAEDDRRGDRLVVNDERWLAIMRSPDPHPIPLLFVSGGSVRIVQGEAKIKAGVSKPDRHRGHFTLNEQVRKDRLLNGQTDHGTKVRAYYALLPVLDTDDPVIQKILERRDLCKAANPRSRGRGLKLKLSGVPIQNASAKVNKRDLMLPLSFDSRRMEKILSRSDLEIAWARVVRKGDTWAVQFTPRIFYKVVQGAHPVLGVSFGIDAILSWSLINAEGDLVRQGQLSSNQQIAAFLASKRKVEWNQAKGRWVGGDKRFASQLGGIAHEVSNQIVGLAQHFGAVVSIHDIQWVEKSGPDALTNELFTAWNYGQLRRQAGYKLPLHHCGKPAFTHDFLVHFTCPSCGALRETGEKPNEATTWITGDTLHCRNCGYNGTPNGLERSLIVAKDSLERYWRPRWKREEDAAKKPKKE